MTTQVIKNKAQHGEYLAEAEYLISLDPEPGTAEGDRLELLSILIEKYEKENFPIDKPDPIEAIEFRMEQQGLKQKDLIPYIGSKSKVSEVLSRKRPLTLQMIRNLNQGLGISTDVLVQDLNALSKESEQADWSKFPLREMARRKWIDASLEEIKEKGNALLIKYFNSPEIKSSAGAFFRRSFHERSNKKMDHYALQAWVARVFKLANKESLKKNYQQGLIDDEFLKKVGQLSWSSQGPALAKEFLSKHGIALVIEKHLPKTHLDGASMLSIKQQPIIGLTLRHDRLDNFWFTLLHELAHVSRHLKDTEEIYLDDIDVDAKTDSKEIEADYLAREMLIPKNELVRSDAYLERSKSSILKLAKELNIHPSIVVGRLHWETKDFTIHRDLLGQGIAKKLLNN